MPIGPTTVAVGPVTIRTPLGLSEELFFQGLAEYKAREHDLSEKGEASRK